jgi:excisionase family DNA binding protein
MIDNILTLPQAAKTAGVHPRTVRRWIDDGHVNATKHGVNFAVDAASLQRYLITAPVKKGKPQRGNGQRGNG